MCHPKTRRRTNAEKIDGEFVHRGLPQARGRVLKDSAEAPSFVTMVGVTYVTDIAPFINIRYSFAVSLATESRSFCDFLSHLIPLRN
jgi:hypothetical protein